MVVPLQVISLQPCSISCLSDNNLQKKKHKNFTKYETVNQ